MIDRQSLIDRAICELDRAVRTVAGIDTPAKRENPALAEPETELTEAERDLSVRLMRVNHAGEIAAQALYGGQMLTAKNSTIYEAMQTAREEENDHLIWCRERLAGLGATPSFLAPVWYLGSIALGALAGLAGDRVSLGFLAETEKQVVAHLDDHLERLPADDLRSRRIVQAMKEEEAEHEATARDWGAEPVPLPIQVMMRLMSKFMTKTAFWI